MTYEKEAYAVFQTFRRLKYLLGCAKRVKVFTDHRNVLISFDPTVVGPSLGRHKVLEVIRWALYLSDFAYDIEHVPGTLNTMVDIIKRWMRGYRRLATTTHLVARMQHFYGANLVPTMYFDKGSCWRRGMLLTAPESGGSAPPSAISDEDELLRMDGKVWIPPEADGLKIKLLTIAHAA